MGHVVSSAEQVGANILTHLVAGMLTLAGLHASFTAPPEDHPPRDRSAS